MSPPVKRKGKKKDILSIFEEAMREKMVKGDIGLEGMRGLIGLEGRRGEMGLEGEKGDVGKVGKIGKTGKIGERGKDGKVASHSEMRLISEVKSKEKVREHEEKHNHDPFIVGSKKISEAGLEDGMFLMYDAKGNRLVYVEPPKAEKKRGTLFRNSSGARVRWIVRTITSNYTIRPDDDVIHADCSGGDIIITMFDATTTKGKNVFIKRIDSTLANDVTFAVQGSEKIEFESLYKLVNQGSGCELYSDSVDFFIKTA